MEPEKDITRSHVQLAHDSIIGHYRIVEQIGAGGMGEVTSNAKWIKFDKAIHIIYVACILLLTSC
jgi:ABC-type methionine transport system permease subunit